MDVIGIFLVIGLLYYLNNREASKPLRSAEDLADAIANNTEYQGLKREEILLQVQQNVSAAHTQRAVRNIEYIVIMLLVTFLIDATGWAFWN